MPHVPIHFERLFFLVEYLGVLVGALAGALATIRDTRYRYDVVGVVGLSFASALGGGICRDIILQRGTPLAFTDIYYLLLTFAGAFAGLLWGKRVTRVAERAMNFVDALALGLFAVAGTARALNAGLFWLPALLLGVVTAAGGGSLRDVLSGRTPRVFEGGQFYALAALFGSSMFLLSDAAGLSRSWATLIGTFSGILLRLLAVAFNWHTHPVVAKPVEAKAVEVETLVK